MAQSATDKQVRLYFPASQHQAVREAAARCALSMAEFARRAVLAAVHLPPKLFLEKTENIVK